MRRVPNVVLAIAFGLAVGASVTACSSTDSGLAAGAALPGAVYAGQLPLYPSATFDGAMGGNTHAGGVGGPVVSDSLSWFFTVSDAPERVLAFYESKLPGAERGAWDTGEPTLTLVPPGAEAGEYLRVTVSEGKLQITEVVRPGKRKDG
jgi:hypothetical protein